MSHSGENIVGTTQGGASLKLRSLLCASVFLGMTAVSMPAFAQEKTDNSTLNSVPPTEGLTLNVTPSRSQQSIIQPAEFVGIGSSLQDVEIELPAESIGSSIFNMDVSDTACLTGERGCLRRDDTVDVGYSKTFFKELDGSLDIELKPSAALRFDDESSSAIVGALVRIGDDLREDSDLDNNTWYMFAGADAEAVTYEPNSVRRMTSGQFHLQDRIIVGDAQAGVGYRIGDADVSLGYFRREVTSFGREVNSGSVSFKEDAAALSFTWRR